MNTKEDFIIITAARPGVWIREKLSPSRMFGEYLVSDYKEKMEVLRAVDDKIYSWTKDLGKIVKEMQKALKAARYLDLAILISNLNKRLEKTVEIGDKVKNIQQDALKEFEHKSPTVERENLDDDLGFVAEAGIMDWVGNSDFARRFVERKFRDKFRKEREIVLRSIVDRANLTVKEVENYLSNLHKARAQGEIGKYIDILRLISKSQEKFYSFYSPKYEKYLKPIVEEAENEGREIAEQEFENAGGNQLRKEIEQDYKEESIPNVEVPDLNIPSQKSSNDDIVVEEEEPNTLSVRPSELIEENKSSNKISPVNFWENVEESGPITKEVETYQKDPETQDDIVPETKELETQVMTKRSPRLPEVSAEIKEILFKNANNKFMKELKRLSQLNDPYLISAAILRFSEEVEIFDENKSIQLIQLAQRLIDETPRN